jgi:hypothetical protein
LCCQKRNFRHTRNGISWREAELIGHGIAVPLRTWEFLCRGTILSIGVNLKKLGWEDLE